MNASVVVATGNPAKLAEFRQSLALLDATILSAAEAGICSLPQETGASYIENALLKSRHVVSQTNLPAIADDSGLEINALAGKPGIYSARFGGTLSDEERVDYLLEELKGVPTGARGARFVCSIAFSSPSGQPETFRGQVVGEILRDARGRSGFGYDPVFFSPELGKTFAEATEDEKRRVSHRGKALREFLTWSRTLAGKKMISGTR
jgi:XTP/dITP diphosphohydrolase